RDLPRDAKLSVNGAEKRLRLALSIAEKVNADSVHIEDGAHLGYFAEYRSPVPPQLVWVFEAAPSGWDRELYYVDSDTGLVAFRRRPGSDGPTRENHSAEVVGAACRCTGDEKSAATRIGPDCGRRMELSWQPLGEGTRYIGLMARPDLGWTFATLAIDTHATQ